jgi:L-threonylcarbamoyladenylate synthase
MTVVTEVLAVDPGNPDPAALERAAACLRAGGLVAFPTETVYGLGVHALDRAAVRRLFEAKQRPSHDPLIVHIASAADLPPLVTEVPRSAALAAARFWPGPLTIVLRRSAAIPDEVTAGLDTVAIRVPSHPVAHALIARAGVPVAAPSANLFSRPSPTRGDHVLQDLAGRIDMLLDGGPTSLGLESTVLDLSQDPPAVLRPGAVTLETLREAIGHVIAGRPAADEQDAPRSPGLLSRHYSPRTPLALYTGQRAAALRRMIQDIVAAITTGQRVGAALTTEDMADVRDALAGSAALDAVTFAELGRARDPGHIARSLYDALRQLDAARVDRIVIRDIDATSGIAIAVRDRLRRAAAGRIVAASST